MYVFNIYLFIFIDKIAKPSVFNIHVCTKIDELESETLCTAIFFFLSPNCQEKKGKKGKGQ